MTIGDLYFRSRQWNIIPTRNDYMFSDLFLFDGDDDAMELTRVDRERYDPCVAAGIPLFRGHPFTKIALFVNTLQHAKRVQSLFTAKYAAQGKVHGAALSFFDRNILNSINIVFWSSDEGYFESIPSVSEDLASSMDDEIMNMYRLVTEVAALSPANEIRSGAGKHLVFHTPTAASSHLTADAGGNSLPNPDHYASYLIESELAVRVRPETYALRMITPVNDDDLVVIATALNDRYGANMFRVEHADPDR